MAHLKDRNISAERFDSRGHAHALLAELGKRVLRPGGLELTRTLLTKANLFGADVVELAPGLGRTATDILRHRPRSYIGIDNDAHSVEAVRRAVGEAGTARVGDAAATGLLDKSADVVLGEAMLTMQGTTTKNDIVAEAVRVLRPGGRYVIHELALRPDDLPDEVKTEIRRSLARVLKVNARPQTIAEWRQLLEAHGLVVDQINMAPMALLQPHRIVSDEGPVGALRFGRNLVTHPAARRRIIAMRRIFRQNREALIAVGMIAILPREH